MTEIANGVGGAIQDGFRRLGEVYDNFTDQLDEHSAQGRVRSMIGRVVDNLISVVMGENEGQIADQLLRQARPYGQKGADPETVSRMVDMLRSDQPTRDQVSRRGHNPDRVADELQQRWQPGA